jgi:hypothetical protein
MHIYNVYVYMSHIRIQTYMHTVLWIRVGRQETKQRDFPRSLTFGFCVKISLNALLRTGKSEHVLFCLANSNAKHFMCIQAIKTYIKTHTHTHTHTHTKLHLHVVFDSYIHAYTRTKTAIHTSEYIFKHSYGTPHTYTHTYIHSYICTLTYSHTYLRVHL